VIENSFNSRDVLLLRHDVQRALSILANSLRASFRRQEKSRDCKQL